MDDDAFLDNTPDEIEAQFQDFRSSGKNGTLHSRVIVNSSAMDTSIDDDEQQDEDYEWVEESEYIILDFGGAGQIGKDMAAQARQGYSLIVSFPLYYPLFPFSFCSKHFCVFSFVRKSNRSMRKLAIFFLGHGYS
jgi:hypothetical protein